MGDLAAAEDRTPSQIAAAALRFWVLLPPEAHAALRYVEARGTADDLDRVRRDATRALLDAQFEVAQRGIVAAMRTADLGPVGTEDQVFDAAVRLTGQPARQKD